MWVQSLDQEDAQEQEVATQSSILAWKIPWTEEPGGLQSMGLQKSQTQLSSCSLQRKFSGMNDKINTIFSHPETTIPFKC